MKLSTFRKMNRTNFLKRFGKFVAVKDFQDKQSIAEVKAGLLRNEKFLSFGLINPTICITFAKISEESSRIGDYNV